MFDRLDSLSDELLAAYLDGNTTPEENLKIWQVLQHDGQEREAFEVACNRYSGVFCCIVLSESVCDSF